MTLPPPKTASSPPPQRSCSTSMTRSVSARRTRSPVVGPYSWRYRAREISIIDRTSRLATQSEDDAIAADRDQWHRPSDPGFEPDRRARRYVQSESTGTGSVELEGGVGLEEVVVGADLDRPVAGVDHVELDGHQAC